MPDFTIDLESPTWLVDLGELSGDEQKEALEAFVIEEGDDDVERLASALLTSEKGVEAFACTDLDTDAQRPLVDRFMEKHLNDITELRAFAQYLHEMGHNDGLAWVSYPLEAIAIHDDATNDDLRFVIDSVWDNEDWNRDWVTEAAEMLMARQPNMAELVVLVANRSVLEHHTDAPDRAWTEILRRKVAGDTEKLTANHLQDIVAEGSLDETGKSAIRLQEML